MTRPPIRFVFAGLVDRVESRGRRFRGYRWVEGWSENGVTYPWLTRREAQADARARGARAVFVRPPLIPDGSL